MRLTLSLFSTLLCASSVLGDNSPHKRRAFDRVKESIEKRKAPAPAYSPTIQKRSHQFLTEKSKPFAVNGSAIPDVPFDVGESYAGLLPISDDPNETRKLFFWFFPSLLAQDPKEIVIWFNGGPGCSSLSGLLTENGPFTWESGTFAPVQNSYSWTNLTNVVWVEQPVGVGFTQGVPNITDEIQLAAEYTGFWKNFITTFDMQSYDMYVTGESYGGFYVPYVADAFLQKNDTEYFNLKGINFNDPIIGDETNQQQVVIQPYAEFWQDLFYLNDTFRAQMADRQDFCNYSSYLETYFTFPPPGPLPVLPDPYNSDEYTCDMFDNYYGAILLVNPCFNIYHITETCPHPFSQLGIVNTGDYQPAGAQVYFNRTDVQKAINAPVGTNWEQCTDVNVFGNGTRRGSDQSVGPGNDGTLQRVIEATNNVLIGSGDLDALLSTNGTLLAIQNVTWNGQQGFTQYPSYPVYVPYHPEFNGGSLSAAGPAGVWLTERGLTFYTARLAGHELPGYAPGVSYRSLEILLGRVDNFNSTADFTTQSGNFTGNSTIYKRHGYMNMY